MRILDPLIQSSESDLSLYDDLENDQPRQAFGKKPGICAEQPSDLLEGISDMFIHANLSCNFAKRTKQIGWNVLSKSILNKLYPGNAIFKQQLNKLKVDKENYEVEQKKQKRGRKKSKNFVSLFTGSNKKIPKLDFYRENSGSLEKDLVQLNNKFQTITENFNNFAKENQGQKRPIGGKEYEHVKPRYKQALKKISVKSKTRKRLNNFIK